MNQFLADLYGTAESVGASYSDDTEKLAEAKLLDDFFQAEGINVDQLSDETIVKVAYQLFGENSAIVKVAQEEEEEKEEGETAEEEKKEEKEESDEEKVAQADFLGRVMAHSFHQESREIEKRAGPVGEAAKGLAKAIGGAAKGSKPAQWAAKPFKEFGQMASKGGRSGGGFSTAGKLKEVIKGNKGQAAAAAGLAAGVGGAGAYGAKKLMDKKSSALDALAEQRAIEMLKAAGYEAEPSEEEKLAAAVDQRALEMLAAAGYPVE